MVVELCKLLGSDDNAWKGDGDPWMQVVTGRLGVTAVRHPRQGRISKQAKMHKGA